MEDIFNHTLTFLPHSQLREQRLTSEIYTELIERDFPLTVSKDPRERYLGLRDTDIISKGHMLLALIYALDSDSIGKEKYVTDSAVRATMKGKDIKVNKSETIYTSYLRDERDELQIFMYYLRGDLNIDEPSIVISEHSFICIPFSYDYMIYLILGFRKLNTLFGNTDTISNAQLALTVEYETPEQLENAIKEKEELPNMIDPVVIERLKRFQSLTFEMDKMLDKLGKKEKQIAVTE